MIGPLKCFLISPGQCSLLFENLVALLLKYVRAPLQEQNAENVLLELRSIHFTAKDVGSGEQMAFEFFKRKLGH